MTEKQLLRKVAFRLRPGFAGNGHARPTPCRMFRNYLITALRKLRKQRDYTLLNVLGLGLSAGCCILIFLLVRYHFSFDTYHRNAERIARVVMDVKIENPMPFSGVPMPMAKTLREECSFLEKTAMCSKQYRVLLGVDNRAGGKDKYREEEKFAWIEPEYLDILDVPLLRGDAGALREPNTVLLSERMARKYFGATEALGRTVRLDNRTDLRVVGVLRDLPGNTDYNAEILGSWATLNTLPEVAPNLNFWGGARGDDHCLALLKEGHAMRELEDFMAVIREKYPNPGDKNLFYYQARPLLSLHADGDYGFGWDKNYSWALALIGLFLLVTACVNFVNMATAQALTRAREVGVRKSLGSTRGQLFWQFMAETGLIVAASLLTGVVVARAALPYLNSWLDERLDFDAGARAALLVFGLALGVLLSFLAGFYPGWMQARFNPVVSMKGSAEVPQGGRFPLRRVLVATQFAISQVLIIGAAVVTAQMQYARNADWGFRPGAMLTLEIPEPAQMNSLKAELSRIAGVKSVSLCYQPPASSDNNHSRVQYDNRPESEPWLISNKPVDPDYLNTFGLQLVAGRNLLPGDTVREYLVNEAFVRKLNLASPDEILHKNIRLGPTPAPVVGVVRDFHNWELSQPIAPIVFATEAGGYETCALQLAPGNPAPVLAQVRQVWEKHFPDHFYEQRFMDERLGEFLERETLILRLVRTFAGIAIFIGCLGLYGLAAFLAARKRKEIGVRKVLGASLGGILWLFGKEYARLILVAFAVAAPLAWWAMNAWLQDYSYRISIGAGIFAVSLAATFLVAALTVSIQSLKAALINPAISLRSE